MSLLIANRGEIAIRVARTAADLGTRTIAIHAQDDAASLHTRLADDVRALPGSGVAAYLDAAAVLAVAVQAGATAIHPGYGFLSEQAAFARACAAAGIRFVGPRPELLELFGDKVRARHAAAAAGVPVLRGTDGPIDVAAAEAFLTALPEGRAMVLKAVAGGGGRGMRVVQPGEDVAARHARCVSEATAAFGDGSVYAEEYLPLARHVEVQILGDGTGAVAHLGERECSVQRRHQKLLEIAPAPGLAEGVRRRVIDAALRIARTVRYDNIGTFEFLVDASDPGDEAAFAFIEANPRLQVEHTVTEEVTGVDIVAVQLGLAEGRTLAELGFADGDSVAPRGTAIQARINVERVGSDGSAMPASGVLGRFDLPAGKGIRVDTFGYAGYRTNPSFDPLVAKVIVHHPGGYGAAVDKLYRALCEVHITGVDTNVGLLRDLVSTDGFRAGRLRTTFIEDWAARQAEEGSPRAEHRARYVEPQGSGDGARAGAQVDRDDPLAVLEYGKQQAADRAIAAGTAPAAEPGSLTAPMQGTVVEIAVSPGEEVRAGQLLAVREALQMEHELKAATGGVVVEVTAAAGDTVLAGTSLLRIEERDVQGRAAEADEVVDLDEIRPDLAEILGRRAATLDANRPAAVARRRATGQRTARENVADLVDEGTFVELGQLALAAQRSRRSRQELIEKSPADGMITGFGSINGELFEEPANRCAVMAYDYTVFAGTQGIKNHAKTDRMIEMIKRTGTPLVLFAEGGGGRPGDTAGGDFGSMTFGHFPQLSGLVPMVGIVSGFCFAGNASLLGCCDVIIATRNANIGMGGPAMIEGGGLGVYRPEEIGPVEVQSTNGVIDVVVEDEAAAVVAAKQYVGYFQGRLRSWEAPDQREMRRIIPENRLRIYDIRRVIDTLADVGTVLELRRGYGIGMITALIRVEGRPVGVVANNPAHLGGAIDSDGADKAAHFMQLCDCFDIPVLQLCDTPGIMVGPEVERTALVRHSSRMFLVGANLTVPTFTVIVRKAYGLGGVAMAGGSFKLTTSTVAWPTGEFGPMGLEGAVKLAFRNELAAIEDPVARKAEFDRRVDIEYRRGKAINLASGVAIDDTIDPAETRSWLANLLASVRPAPPREGKKRPIVDAW
ncbi:MAG: carbamoyl-phosphate synthase large subunit [Acidimicrobiales bacterium]|nr:carbamoyl-phosphate synthase large subunit [Acidimicrobiales bacterium]